MPKLRLNVPTIQTSPSAAKTVNQSSLAQIETKAETRDLINQSSYKIQTLALDSQSDYFGQQSLHSPGNKSQAGQRPSTRSSGNPGLRVPQKKTIDFDYSHLTKFDRQVLEQLVSKDVINVEDTLVISKQKLGKEDKSLKIFNPSSKARRGMEEAEKVGKVSFLPTPASPTRSAKHTLQLGNIINNLNDANKLRNRFADRVQSQKFDDILGKAREVKERLLEQFPYQTEKSNRKAAKLKREVEKEEYNARLERGDYLESQLDEFNNRFHQKRDIIKQRR
jgi:hypothetical protein